MFFMTLAMVVLSCLFYYLEAGAATYTCVNGTADLNTLVTHTEVKRQHTISTDDHTQCADGTHQVAFYTLKDGQVVDSPSVDSIPAGELHA